MNNNFKTELADHFLVFEQVALLEEKVSNMAAEIYDAFDDKRKVLICGNGGSAADSQHMAAELVGRFRLERKALAAIALTTDTSNITSIANDYDYDQVFSRQVEALGHNGDILIGISTSGNSQNVVNAINTAKQNGLKTFGLLGGDGGRMAHICDKFLHVEGETARIQEAHIFLIHQICGQVENLLTGGPNK